MCMGRLEAEKSEVIDGPAFGGGFHDVIWREMGGGEIRGELGDRGTCFTVANDAATEMLVAIT